MTTESYYRLQQLSNDELLTAIAFELQDYEKGAQEALARILDERKLSQQDVVALRKSRLPKDKYPYICVLCNEALFIDGQELWEGGITCPGCQTAQLIDFKQFPYKAMSDVELLTAIAFKLQDYGTNAQERLANLLEERKLDNKDVIAHRKSLLPKDNYPYICGHCSEALFLDGRELWDGIITCPECKTTQQVDFERFPDKPWQSHSPKSTLEGLGGWLILVGFGLILGPAAQFIGLLSLNELGEIVFSLVFILPYIGLGILFFRRHHLFPKLYIGMLVFDLVVEILASMTESEGMTIQTIGRTTIRAAIWIPYMLQSRRVKNTFVLSFSKKSSRQHVTAEAAIEESAQLDEGPMTNAEQDSTISQYEKLLADKPHHGHVPAQDSVSDKQSPVSDLVDESNIDVDAQQVQAGVPEMAVTDSEDNKNEVPVIMCTRCKIELESQFDYCPKCGEVIVNTCSACNRQIDRSSAFCPYCGTSAK